MRRYAWPASRALQPQEAIRWPLWVHPRDRGPFSFHLAFYYEPLTPVEGLKHRSAAAHRSATSFCVELPAWGYRAWIDWRNSRGGVVERALGLYTAATRVQSDINIEMEYGRDLSK